MTTKEIRTRFAPSPTGELHIGGLRTALMCFLFARKNNGVFIVRSEDTDQERLVEGSAKRQVLDILWAGLTIDEGVMIDKDGKLMETGTYGPYVQSKRLAIYKKYVQQLLDEKKAYHCFCSSHRLELMRKEQQAQKLPPKYDRKCLSLSDEEVQKKIKDGESYVVRFKIPEGTTTFTDEVYGKISVNNETLDDQILMKSDGFPTYHLAVVVDDYLMKISHVFRGVEWIASTPKHILLYQALGWQDAIPVFVHMANILNKNRKKLSKREGSVSVADFRAQGYPRQALINFIALLGWNPKTKQEIFTMDELIEQFAIKKMNKAGGIFDLDRLAWISKEHIKGMKVDEIYIEALPFIKKNALYMETSEDKRTPAYIKKIITVEHERLEKFTDIGKENPFFWQDVIVDKNILRWKENTDTQTIEALTKAKDECMRIDEKEWTRENLEEVLMNAAGDKRGDFLWPLRAALTGQKRSPSPFDCAWVLGKKETIARIDKALETLKKK